VLDGTFVRIRKGAPSHFGYRMFTAGAQRVLQAG
jgi:hypothetical protein